MRKILLASAAILGVAAVAATPAAAKGKFVQIVPVSGSTSTNVFGINDSDIITGSWLDSSGVEHGYIGPVSGTSYTTFDDPNATTGTEPRAIDDASDVTGFGNSQGGSTTGDLPFERTSDGTLTEITKKGKPLNYLAQGINSKGVFAASYANATTGIDYGYLGRNAAYSAKIKLSIKNAGYAGRGIDTAGDVVGWYLDTTTGLQHGFLISGGSASTLDYKATNESYTVLEGINDKGTISGQWGDTSGVVHSFLYDMNTQTFKDVIVKGATTFTQVWGVNNNGLVAVGSNVGYYIYCPPKTRCVKAADSASLRNLPHQEYQKLPQ